MTAIKPIENRRVRAVASERYPLNKICAHPECTEPAVDPHHAFPRSAIGGDSWFVQIVSDCMKDTDGDGNCPLCAHWTPDKIGTPSCRRGLVIPHVTGLCREHHDIAELRNAWIRYDEDEGVWSWWDKDTTEGATQLDWIALGALNPQPGSEGKPKAKRKWLKDGDRRKRKTISIRVPQDTEDGGALWDEMWERVQERLYAEEAFDEATHIPVYEGLMAALNDWLNN